MSKTALLLVDLQNDYFSGGKFELVGMQAAASNAALLLNTFRQKSWPIVHIRHEFATADAPFFIPDSEGAKTHPSVQPLASEPIVLKHQINSFRETPLKSILDDLNIDSVLICGAMSHMCIDAVTRAANDFGYSCSVAHDACATLDLTFNGIHVPAHQVHAAFMASLSFAYANVDTTEVFLNTVTG